MKREAITALLSLAAVFAASLAAASAVGLAAAQTLARPNWAGSGLNLQPWWKHAVLCQVDVRTFDDADGDGIGDLKGVARRLSYLKSLGIDGILLKSLTPAGPAMTAAASPIDPALGTLDDFDDLSREASRRDLRILVMLNQPASNSTLVSLARFWLSRGVAGFQLPPGSAPEDAASLQRLLSTYTGQRLLITISGTVPAVRQASAELLLTTAPSTPSGPPSAAQLRSALQLTQTQATPLLAADSSGIALLDQPHAAASMKALGTLALLNRSASLLLQGQELGLAGPPPIMPWGALPAESKPESLPEPESPAASPAPAAAPSTTASESYVPYAPLASKAAHAPCAGCLKKASRIAPDPATVAGQDADPTSVLNFYRQLSRLHHGNAALRDGEQIVLNHDDLNALVWVRRTRAVTPLSPAVVIVCNLSAQPLVLPLKAELARLHLRGSFLRTLLRSDQAMGSLHLDSITVPPFGVYVGELRY